MAMPTNLSESLTRFFDALAELVKIGTAALIEELKKKKEQ